MAIIEIDGKKLEVPVGRMIIEAADEAGIAIPRFCYHKNLSIAANCRMCLVEVNNNPKTVPACATPIVDGMKVFTRSEKALVSQKAVMEFLLINHPLDCPICDQGGECELQDVSLGYGKDHSTYNEEKRVVHDEDLGPLVSTEMTRCIHCTRCVRFGDEIAGLRELGGTFRGEDMKIGTYVAHALHSNLSGNIIDLCPVGALTSKPFRFKARAWELLQFPSIAPHDCIGSNINAHIRGKDVLRVVPRENTQLNETWISDRDRFSYLGLNSPDRLKTPLIKKNGQWQVASWQTALNEVTERLKNISKQYGGTSIGGLASPSSTIEELYLFQKWLRDLGTSNIDHRIRMQDFSDQDSWPISPIFKKSYQDIENYQRILLIGSNLENEQPLLAVKVRKALKNGAKVTVINPMDFKLNFEVAQKIIVPLYSIFPLLLSTLKSLGINNIDDSLLSSLLRTAAEKEEAIQLAQWLKSPLKTLFLMGAQIQNHPHFSWLRVLIEKIAKYTEADEILLTEGCNSAGAWLAGAVPHRESVGYKCNIPGLNVKEMLKRHLKAYCLLGLEPELDCANPVNVLRALHQADLVVSLTAFRNDEMLRYADILLPVTPFTETSGTYVNLEGQWQSFNAIVNPLGESKPGWKVLRMLNHLLGNSPCEYTTSEEIRNELNDKYHNHTSFSAKKYHISDILPIVNENKLYRLSEWPIYSVDSLVRRSLPLQKTPLAQMPEVIINSKVAEALGFLNRKHVTIIQGEHTLELPLKIDESIPDQSAYIISGHTLTSMLGNMGDELHIA